jgi:FkbH-like protein
MEIRINPEDRNVLFSNSISRREVIERKYDFLNESESTLINIWRNTGVEAYLPIIERYLEYFGFKARFNISAFDSSFDLRSWEIANLDLIYISILDLDSREILDLLSSRIKDLYELGSKNISVAIQIPPERSILDVDLKLLGTLFPDVVVFVVSKDKMKETLRFQDERLETISGNWLSMDAYSIFGKIISLNLILPFLITRIKLIAVDLDNTLYNGVLGEDGLNGIRQSDFQQNLVSWLEIQKKCGSMLAVVSRNEIEDVNKLFERFSQWKILFDFVYASWTPKENIFEEILNVTRISEDSILFIDDSMSEIKNVQSAFPKMQCIVFTDEESTINLLQSHPGFLSKKISVANIIDRASDLKSNKIRDSIFSSLSDKDAFKELQVRLQFESSNVSLLPRSVELSNKTNQFNFALKRFSEYQLKTYLNNVGRKAITSNLSDRYANSGIVSLLCIDYSSLREIRIDEFCISCRALGRGLEDEIFFGSLAKALESTHLPDFSRISISYQKGDRNSPAVNWAVGKNWIIESDRIEVPIGSYIEWETLIAQDSPLEF